MQTSVQLFGSEIIRQMRGESLDLYMCVGILKNFAAVVDAVMINSEKPRPNFSGLKKKSSLSVMREFQFLELNPFVLR